MRSDYLINEGNKIGYMPTEFGTTGALVEKKLVASGEIKKGNIVEVSDNLTVKVTTAASANVLGVAMFDAKDGDPVSVECEGLVYLVASGAITAPAEVESATGGKVATKGGTPVKIIGLAISDAVDNGDVIVRLTI